MFPPSYSEEMCIRDSNQKLILIHKLFTSFLLLKTLNERRLFAVGTVRPNRNGLPDMLKTKHIWSVENLCSTLKVV